ncbi:hypothetical protein BJX65DRAFT_260317 [Aspergillus insuetus]
MWRPMISSWPRSMASVSAKTGRTQPCHEDTSLSTRVTFQELPTLYSTKYGWNVLVSVMGIAPWPSAALVDRVNATFVCSSGVIFLCPSCIRTVARRLVGLEIYGENNGGVDGLAEGLLEFQSRSLASSSKQLINLHQRGRNVVRLGGLLCYEAAQVFNPSMKRQIIRGGF